jgi:hypothetical protein
MKSKTERMALDNLEKNLRESGLWGKIKTVYPIIGGGYLNKKVFNLKHIPRYRRMGKIRNIFKLGLFQIL